MKNKKETRYNYPNAQKQGMLSDAPAGIIDPNGTVAAPAPRPYTIMTTGPGYNGGNMAAMLNAALQANWDGNISRNPVWESLSSFGYGGGSAGQNTVFTHTVTAIFDMIENGASIDEIISFAKNDGNPVAGIGSPGASGDDQNHLSDDNISTEKTDYKVDITKGTNDSYQDGITINFTYLGDLSKYKNVDFIQSIVTDYKGMFSITNDYMREDGAKINIPFYYPTDARTKMIRQRDNLNYGGIHFRDMPGRFVGSDDNYFWRAELSVVGERNGRYQNIATFTYGFMLFQGTLYLLDFNKTQPSNFQVSLINQANH